MKKYFKRIAAGMAVLLASIGFYFYKTAPLIVDTIVVEPKEAYVYFTEKGTVASQSEISLYPLVSGEIIKAFVAEGDRVSAGDILFEIDKTPYEWQLKKAEASIKSYHAQIEHTRLADAKEKDSLSANKNSLLAERAALQSQKESAALSSEEQIRIHEVIVSQAHQNYDFAKNNFQNIERLYQQGIISKTEYDTNKNELDNLQSVLDQSIKNLSLAKISPVQSGTGYYKGMLDSIDAQIDGINNNLNKNYSTAMESYYASLAEIDRISIEMFQKNIEDCFVKTPTDGIVTWLNTESNVASTATSLAKISSPKTNVIECYVSTRDISEIHIGDIVSMRFEKRSGDLPLSGVVEEIAQTAETLLSPLGVEEKKVRVKITCDNEMLKNGYELTIAFTVFRENDKLLVPKAALFKNDGKDMIFVVENGLAKTVPVVTGMETRTETVIERGLAPSDIIIANCDIDGLREGIKIDSNVSK